MGHLIRKVGAWLGHIWSKEKNNNVYCRLTFYIKNNSNNGLLIEKQIIIEHLAFFVKERFTGKQWIAKSASQSAVSLPYSRKLLYA